MSEELKPCPFCGHKPEEIENENVHCSNGECRMFHIWFVKADWNTRTRPLSRPAAQKNANNSNMEFMAEEYDDGVGGGSELTENLRYAITQLELLYQCHPEIKGVGADEGLRKMKLALSNAPLSMVPLDRELVAQELFEKIWGLNWSYYPEDSPTKETCRGYADIVIAKFSRPALEPLDEKELSDFIWKQSRGILINATASDDLAKAICQRFGTRPAHKCDKPECETCNGNGAGEFRTRSVVTKCECSNEGPRTVKVHHSCPRCGGKIAYSRDNISEITGNPGKTEALLKEWLNFSEDVRPNDAAGTDWLDDLTAKTERVLSALQSKDFSGYIKRDEGLEFKEEL